MVCVPCFIVPVLLFLWRLVVVPIYKRFFGKPETKGKEAEPAFPFECKGGVCPIKPKDKGEKEKLINDASGDSAVQNADTNKNKEVLAEGDTKKDI